MQNQAKLSVPNTDEQAAPQGQSWEVDQPWRRDGKFALLDQKRDE